MRGDWSRSAGESTRDGRLRGDVKVEMSRLAVLRGGRAPPRGLQGQGRPRLLREGRQVGRVWEPWRGHVPHSAHRGDTGGEEVTALLRTDSKTVNTLFISLRMQKDFATYY